MAPVPFAFDFVSDLGECSHGTCTLLLPIPDSVCDSGWGSFQAPPTLPIYLYSINSFSDAGEAPWSL